MNNDEQQMNVQSRLNSVQSSHEHLNNDNKGKNKNKNKKTTIIKSHLT